MSNLTTQPIIVITTSVQSSRRQKKNQVLGTFNCLLKGDVEWTGREVSNVNEDAVSAMREPVMYQLRELCTPLAAIADKHVKLDVTHGGCLSRMVNDVARPAL